MPSEGFDQIHISFVVQQWKMPVQNKKIPIIFNMPLCIYTAMAISGYMLCVQQTSVKCRRYTELDKTELIANVINMLTTIVLLLVITFLVMTNITISYLQVVDQSQNRQSPPQ